MIEYIVVQAIRSKWVVDVVVLVGVPVLSEFFRAEDEDVLVAVLIVFHDGKCGKCLAEADAVREDAAAICIEFVDDGKDGVALEVVEHAPYFALFESRGFVRELVLREVVQELAEYVIERCEVDHLGRMLCIGGADVLDDGIRDVLHARGAFQSSSKVRIYICAACGSSMHCTML